MKNVFLTSSEAAELIARGTPAVFAGSEEALGRLPHGTWVGGTTAYFMTDNGGTVDTERVFCTVITAATAARIAVLPPEAVPNVATERYASGFTYLLVPAFSTVHRNFAIDGPAFESLFDQPTMGWVTGVHLSQLGSRTPKVFDGRTGRAYDNAAVALYAQLPEGLIPELDIVNLFKPGRGPSIVFPQTDFAAGACLIGGKRSNIAEYLAEAKIDTRLPLVADYAGVVVNASVRSVDLERGEVLFYAPVVAHEQYHVAEPVVDYERAYALRAGSSEQASRMLSCNCVLNYLYAGLEGKSTGGFVGPVTFGEIAYILLNQTLVRLNVRPAAALATAFRRSLAA
jgi:hypothetical protein